MFDNAEEQCYLAINNGFSLHQLCQIYEKDEHAITHIFSKQAQTIVDSGISCFEELLIVGATVMITMI